MYKINLKTFDPDKCSESVTGQTAIQSLQVAVYVMSGGGLLGRMAAEQPADFYIDSRTGRLPYSKRSILQTVGVLKALAEHNGLDTHHTPPMPTFHKCGTF